MATQVSYRTQRCRKVFNKFWGNEGFVDGLIQGSQLMV